MKTHRKRTLADNIFRAQYGVDPSPTQDCPETVESIALAEWRGDTEALCLGSDGRYYVRRSLVPDKEAGMVPVSQAKAMRWCISRLLPNHMLGAFYALLRRSK